MSKIHNKNRQNFLLTFFGDNGQEDKEINGFWLVKHWNGNTKEWQVAIYPKSSYKNLKVAQNEFNQKSLDWI